MWSKYTVIILLFHQNWYSSINGIKCEIILSNLYIFFTYVSKVCCKHNWTILKCVSVWKSPVHFIWMRLWMLMLSLTKMITKLWVWGLAPDMKNKIDKQNYKSGI